MAPNSIVSRSSDETSFDEVQLSKNERIEAAYKEWTSGQTSKSQRQLAAEFGLSKSTLNDRINGASSKAQRDQSLQRVWVEEETAIAETLTRLQSWGWPARVQHARFMAEQILQARGDMKPLGKNWVQTFLRRHPKLKSKYVPPLDKDRAMAQHPVILKEWFELFQRYRLLFDVKNDNIYNMDEKGFLQGVISKLRVIINKCEANQLITQPDNREWTSLIECVSVTGRKLRPWVIFKGVLLQKAWVSEYPEAHFACTKNGWTNNEIELLWLQQCFDAETAVEDEYRILCVDGHASHISTKAIEFCVQKKIILLCLPAHTTHILQPLDVGVFDSLATAYKNLLHETTRFGAGYAIDKFDFLKLLKVAREKGMTEENIRKAWTKAGLEPYNPQPILHEYRDRENPALKMKLLERRCSITVVETPPESPTEAITGCQISESSIRTVLMTPHNGAQVQKLLEQAMDMPEDAAEIAKKVGKCAVHAFATASLLTGQREQLMTLVSKKKSKKQRQKGALSSAIVVNQEVLDERRLHWDWDTAWRALSEIHLDVCGRRRTKSHEDRKNRWDKAVAKKGATPRKPRFSKRPVPTASPTKKGGPATTSAEENPTVEVEENSMPEKNSTTVNEPLASTTTTEPVATKEKRNKLLISLPIRVSNQDLQHGRWRKQ